LALVLAAVAYAFPLPGLPEEGRRLTSVLAVVATLWISELLPLAVTALLGPALAVVVGVAEADVAFAAFGNPILMLFIGSFLLAHATFKFRLNERIAYRVLSLGILANEPTRAFFFLGLTTAAISAWISNAATTAMMLPIAQAVLMAMTPAGGGAVPRTFAAGMMLVVTYSASIGGLFTPIGTPPNLIGLGLIEQATGVRITFVEWIGRVFPVTFTSLLLMMAYFAILFRDEKQVVVYDRTRMLERYRALGPWTRDQLLVTGALLVTVTLWLAPPFIGLLSPALDGFLTTRFAESVVPILVAGVLCLMRREDRAEGRLIDIDDLARIDWPVIVLFGGGMCLGDLMLRSGLADAIGSSLADVVPAGNRFLLVLTFCALAIGVSETTSNTASANMVVPIVVAVAARAGADPVALGLAATVACTYGFMLPVSTPTNAMAYATGRVTQRQMIRYGFVLDLTGILLLTVWFGLLS
jgi:sodium-dependent dicarboxylate transporter 2/3/5